MIKCEVAVERALVLHPVIGRPMDQRARFELEEVLGLTEALGAELCAHQIIPLKTFKSGHYFGSGKVAELAELIERKQVSIVIVNASVTPIQQRNLERFWKVKVIDRTGVILEIFGLRAVTKEGRLQVELARLNYERSRLVRTWTHLERQAGGQGFLAGPGESQIESDRRYLAAKIKNLKRDLEQIRRTRALQRTKRKRALERAIALVGYTNAGKSALFNVLTKANVLSADMLFATLDTTHRFLKLPNGQRAVLSDTVGFISDLPTDLVNAFRATLEEVREADVLIHVGDMSDPLLNTRRKNVMDILKFLRAGPEFGQSLIEVWNKIDLLDEAKADLMRLAAKKSQQSGDIAAFVVSYETGEGLQALLQGLEDMLTKRDELVDIRLFPEKSEIRAWLHAHGDVVREDIGQDGEYAMCVKLSPTNLGRLRVRHPDILN